MANLIRRLVLVALSAGALACQRSNERVSKEFKNVEVRAVVHPSRVLEIVSPAEGVLKSLRVREGDAVKRGEVVASLWNDELRRELAAAEARTAAVAARLAGLDAEAAAQARSRSSGSSRGAAAHQALWVIVRNKKEKLERYRRLHETRDVSKQELEDAENEYAQALRDEELALEFIRVGPGTSAGRKAIEADLAQVRAEAARVRGRLEALEVRSPFAGTVTRIRTVEGSRLFVRDPIAEVVDLSTVEVRGVVPPEIAQLFRQGMKVEVKVLTVPPKTFHTTISALIPWRGDSSTERGDTVVVVLPNPDRVLSANDKARIAAGI